MSQKSRELTAEERKLWRRVACTIAPLRALPPEQFADPPAPPTARPKLSEQPQSPPPRRGREAGPPPDRSGEKRVRRGKLELGGVLDLHGHSQVSGREALGRFLHVARRKGARVVIVVTGLGRSGEGVLRKRLPEWLGEADLRAIVSGYAPAHRNHGGAGAFYVFIKS